MKIISLQPSVSIILDRLGCLDSLVASTKYCLDAIPALRERSLPIVHDSWSTKTEELLPVRADLVIASVPYRRESLTAILKSGCPVLALAPRTLEEIYQDIRLIASLVQASIRGEGLIAAMQAAIADVRTRTAVIRNRPLVYCEEWGKPLIQSQLWVKELVEAAGGTFLGEPGATVEAEAIAEANPDVIVAAWCGAGDRVPLERIIVQRNWRELRAVTNRRVYCIADELLNTPAPTLIDGLHALAQAIHPDLFGTIVSTSGRQIDLLSSTTSKLKNVEERVEQNGAKTVRFVVAALILRGEEVLICQRRPDQPMALKWEFPGGKIEAGETPEEALVRELNEELGIDADIGSHVAHTRHTYRNGGAVDLQFFAIHAFRGDLTNRIFHDMRWVQLRDLTAYDFLAADRDLIHDLAAGKLL